MQPHERCPPMKPARFAYHRPDSREEVDELLAEHGDDAKVLAGGQSLVPILNMRLAAPAHLVDINRLRDEPATPAAREGGGVVLGPLVRHGVAERAAIVGARAPVLRDALRLVAHPAIRTRGTVAGSLAHADPAAELPAVLVALDGSVVARCTAGRREVAASDLFAGPLETTLRADEWIDEVRLPPALPDRGSAVHEFSRRHGDYAICGVVAIADPASGGGVRVSLTYLAMGACPVRVELGDLDEEDFAASELDDRVRAMVKERLDPSADLHASVAYRRWLGTSLGVRAAREAAESARAAASRIGGA